MNESQRSTGISGVPRNVRRTEGKSHRLEVGLERPAQAPRELLVCSADAIVK